MKIVNDFIQNEYYCEKFFFLFEMTETTDTIFNETIEPSKTLLGDCATWRRY